MSGLTIERFATRQPDGQEQLDNFLDSVHNLPKRKVGTEKGRPSESCKPFTEVPAGRSATGERAVFLKTGVASVKFVDSLEERVTDRYNSM